ncbi:hypothetical protein [Endozoicomonas numazuensis]|uniref:Uncharacterized protein n=1 Tax=Endozoicomonas numazuensis TaxID=1137799 RepID=A0A081ND82_9GAMM|nr:hypothetical protein [Endozoicomonas numazuensis]KEQ16405.1 hypothetical protein GZ78_21290 [Endozoicomonas numazuensis]
MPQPSISQAGIYPTLPKTSGTDSAPVTPQKAENPGRLNRDSLTTVDPKVSLNNGSLEPSRLSGSSFSDHDIQVVSPEDVENKLPSEPSREEQLFAKASDVRERISLEGSQSKPRVDRSSKESLATALKEANSSLKEAKKLQSEAHSLAKEGVLEENLLDAGLGGKQMTTAERHASWAARESDQLVSSRKQDVKALELAQKELKTEKKKAEKADKKAHQALERLQKDASSLGRSVSKIRSKVVAAKDQSSKRLGAELKSLERALKKADALATHGQKLLATADAKQMKHGVSVESVRSVVQHHVADAKAESTRLEGEIASLKKKVKSAKRAENEGKKAQKGIDRQLKQQKRMEQEAAKRKPEPARNASSKEASQKKEETPSVNSQRTVAVAEEDKSKTAELKSRKSRLRKLQPGKTQMRAFLRGITPHKGKSTQALEKAMGDLRKPNDYRQVLADIGASGLDVDEKVRLRSNLSARMLGAMKDPGQFKYFDPEFIEHIMFGNSMVEVQQQYPVSVKKDLERIEKEAARK